MKHLLTPVGERLLDGIGGLSGIIGACHSDVIIFLSSYLPFSYLPLGVKTVTVEIFDECALTMDELIAHSHITIPEAVFRGESLDDWFPLSGKQGENKEGSVHLILSLLVS